MRPIRPLFTARRGRGARRTTSSVSAVLAVCATLALTATACGPGDDNAGGDPSAEASAGSDDAIKIPDELKDRLKEHGFDLDKWKDGEWKNWDKDKWLREAEDYINPIIEDFWDADRMRDADKRPDKPVDNDISGDQGKTDPTPAPVDAQAVRDAVPRQRPRGRQARLRDARGFRAVLRHRGQGPGQPRQVQHGVDRRPLRPRGREGRLVPQHRLRPLVQQRGQVGRRAGGCDRGRGRSVRHLVVRLGPDLRPVDRARRSDRRRRVPRTTSR